MSSLHNYLIVSSIDKFTNDVMKRNQTGRKVICWQEHLHAVHTMVTLTIVKKILLLEHSSSDSKLRELLLGLTNGDLKTL